MPSFLSSDSSSASKQNSLLDNTTRNDYGTNSNIQAPEDNTDTHHSDVFTHVKSIHNSRELYALLLFTGGSLFFLSSTILGAKEENLLGKSFFSQDNKMNLINLAASLGFTAASSLPIVISHGNKYENLPKLIFLLANILFASGNTYNLTKDHNNNAQIRVSTASYLFLLSAITQNYIAFFKSTTNINPFTGPILSSLGCALFIWNAITADYKNPHDVTLDAVNSIVGPLFLMGNIIIASILWAKKAAEAVSINTDDETQQENSGLVTDANQGNTPSNTASNQQHPFLLGNNRTPSRRSSTLSEQHGTPMSPSFNQPNANSRNSALFISSAQPDPRETNNSTLNESANRTETIDAPTTNNTGTPMSNSFNQPNANSRNSALFVSSTQPDPREKNNSTLNQSDNNGTEIIDAPTTNNTDTHSQQEPYEQSVQFADDERYKNSVLFEPGSEGNRISF